MFKKIIIISLFILFFAGMAFYGYRLITPKSSAENVTVADVQKVEKPVVSFDGVHSYNSEDLQTECSSEDKIFCAIERTVKCTIEPSLSVCDKAFVPGFVLGNVEGVDRPTEISFKLAKIKPVTGSTDLSVYTESDCDALWFGLCKGTVVYSLTPHGDEWSVTNIFALEQ